MKVRLNLDSKLFLKWWESFRMRTRDTRRFGPKRDSNLVELGVPSWDCKRAALLWFLLRGAGWEFQWAFSMRASVGRRASVRRRAGDRDVQWDAASERLRVRISLEILFTGNVSHPNAFDSKACAFGLANSKFRISSESQTDPNLPHPWPPRRFRGCLQTKKRFIQFDLLSK